MSAAVLCPGPSLSRLWPGRRDTACVIVVNRAALFVADYDWVAMLDNNSIAIDIVAKATPKIGYLFPPHVEALAWASCRRVLNPWQWHPARTIMRNRLRLTGPMALLSAYGLGHTDIHVYGNDMRGTTYTDGSPVDKPSAGDLNIRWACEPRQWDRTTEYLKSAGCTVTFHREDGTP